MDDKKHSSNHSDPAGAKSSPGKPSTSKNGHSAEDQLEGNPKDWFSHVAIVRSDVQREHFPTEEAYIAEVECIKRSEIVQQEIEKLGVECSIVVANEHLAPALLKLKPQLCFNFVDSVRGSGPLSSGIPGVFDLLHIPYIGAGTLALSISNNKYLTKTLLEAWEIPTPQYQLFKTHHDELDYDLRFPLIVKLNEEHASVGISEKSVVTNEKELRAQVTELMHTYRQPVLVEEFIEGGKELSAYVLESKQMNVFLCEKIFPQKTEGFSLITFETKWAEDLGKQDPVVYQQFSDPDGKITAKIKEDVKLAFEILKMDDIGRMDVMVDKYGNHYLIDCNANPEFSPSGHWQQTLGPSASFRKVLTRMLERNKLDSLGIPLKRKTQF